VYFRKTTITSLPQFRVGHSPQEVCNFFTFILAASLDLQAIDLLQNFDLFMQELLQSGLLLVLLKLVRCLNFLCLVKAPSFKLIVKNLKVFAFFRMHTALDFFLVLLFFLLSQIRLFQQELVITIVPFFAQRIRCSSREPSPDAALDV
jgi:hypothetical protein